MKLGTAEVFNACISNDIGHDESIPKKDEPGVEAVQEMSIPRGSIDCGGQVPACTSDSIRSGGVRAFGCRSAIIFCRLSDRAAIPFAGPPNPPVDCSCASNYVAHL